MSEVRTLTAQQLAADDDIARAVWAGVADDTLEVVDGRDQHYYDAYATTDSRDVAAFPFTFSYGDGTARLCQGDETFVVRATYAALAARLAAVEAWAAAQPDTPRTMSAFLREADCAAYMARYDAGREVMALLKGEAE